jgi:hypothetical protein
MTIFRLLGLTAILSAGQPRYSHKRSSKSRAHTRQTKRQPCPGRHRSATASHVQSIFPHRHLRLSRSSIRRTRTSIVRLKAFAEAAKVLWFDESRTTADRVPRA